jgi:intracellular sulfur oxidation DsrE/DsrF family protein
MNALRVLLHAPTAEALARARRNARNLIKARPEAEVLIIANAAAVASALATPDDTDPHLRLCGNSLAAQGLDNPAGLPVVEAAVVTLAECQADGWAYIRA